MTESIGLIVNAPSGPPSNEIPSALDLPSCLWRADGVAVAVASALAYSTGLVLALMARIKEPRSDEDIHERAAAIRAGMGGQDNPHGLTFTVNGRPGMLLGGEHRDYGWSYPLWVRLGGSPGQDVVVKFGWEHAGIASSDRVIPCQSIAEAVSRAVALW